MDDIQAPFKYSPLHMRVDSHAQVHALTHTRTLVRFPPLPSAASDGVFRLVSYIHIHTHIHRKDTGRHRCALTRVSASFAFCPVIKEPPPRVRRAVSLEILVRFTYFTVKRRVTVGARWRGDRRCLRKGRDAGVDGGGGGGNRGGVWRRNGDGNPAELPECGRLQRR